jgi:hypothetical protein
LGNLLHSDNFHAISTSYANILKEDEDDIHQASLEACDEGYEAEVVEGVDEGSFDASQPN